MPAVCPAADASCTLPRTNHGNTQSHHTVCMFLCILMANKIRAHRYSTRLPINRGHQSWKQEQREEERKNKRVGPLPFQIVRVRAFGASSGVTPSNELGRLESTGVTVVNFPKPSDYRSIHRMMIFNSSSHVVLQTTYAQIPMKARSILAPPQCAIDTMI